MDKIVMKKGLVLTPEDFNGVDWLAKMKELDLNTLGLHSGGGPSHDVMAKLGGFAREEFRKRVSDAGLNLEYEDHAANALLDRSLFKTYPEYFPMHYLFGERQEKGNWCISNPDVEELIASNAVKLASKLVPSTHRHYFWGCDFVGAWCHCSDCSSLIAQDQNLLSVNVMAEALRKTDPEAEVAYLVYLNYDMPKKVKPADGVFMEFAPINRCPRHAINDPDCAINQLYWNSLKKHLNLFAPEKTHILEYWLDVSLYSNWQKPVIRPVLFRDVLRRDIEAYMSLGIKQFTTFAVYMDGEYFQKFGDEELQIYADVLNEFDS